MLKELLEKRTPWFAAAGPEAAGVTHTCGSLTRNLADFPFPCRCSEDESRTSEERILAALDSLGMFKKGEYFSISDLTGIEARILVERRLITRALLTGRGPRGVYISDDQSLSVMINERDHVRATVLAAGLQPQEVWKRLTLIDDGLAKSLDFAFRDGRGYLTAGLDELGTGLRVNAGLHLPALGACSKLLPLVQGIREDYHILDGMFGELGDVPGHFYVLSNRSSLGRSEEEFVYHLRIAVTSILEKEAAAREMLTAGEGQVTVADRVGRAMGIAKGARLLEFNEGLELLSSLRLGVTTGQIEGIDYGRIDELIVLSQPAHIESKAGEECDHVTLSVARGDLFRERFS